MKEQRESVRDVWKVRKEECRVRSYEASYVGSLWHLDFYHSSRKMLAPDGEWYKPIALVVHDDRSRLACHVQRYLTETKEDLVHSLCEAFQNYPPPRVLMTDNSSTMKSG